MEWFTWICFNCIIKTLLWEIFWEFFSLLFRGEHKTLSSWSRLAGQTCRIPNILHVTLPAGKKGCFVLRFSHDGRSLACACNDRDQYPIYIYEVSPFVEYITLLYIYNSEARSLEWKNCVCCKLLTVNFIYFIA